MPITGVYIKVNKEGIHIRWWIMVLWVAFHFLVSQLYQLSEPNEDKVLRAQRLMATAERLLIEVDLSLTQGRGKGYTEDPAY